jgi:hypothetical protein
MKARFNPFPKVSGKYGAPMGRTSNHNIEHDTPRDKLAVSHPQGDYDSGGAYWGLGFKHGPVYAVWIRGKGHETVQYVRAHSREAAKSIVLENGV